MSGGAEKVQEEPETTSAVCEDGSSGSRFVDLIFLCLKSHSLRKIVFE
jgi:hypothetical protein